MMRLLHLDKNDRLSWTEFLESEIPPYAILSHTWGSPKEEVVLRDLEKDAYRQKSGYDKIQFCGRQAAQDGLEYFWVDSCCIDKSSSAELTEAINSMFRWYKAARKCYVYLADVSSANQNLNGDLSGSLWLSAFEKSRWFTRGWTLQELVAPSSVEFFSKERIRLGDKHSLGNVITAITGIDISALRGKETSTFSVAERMAWAANRQTTREEDRAYCLLGIFDIHMPLIYSEGEDKAMYRLHKEIEDLNSIHLKSKLGGNNLSREETIRMGQSSVRDELLASLFYPEHGARREIVKPPWQNTFRWIFPTDQDRKFETCANFSKWLEGDKSLYWISGKAGSGKSTLMAHILHHGSLHEGLKRWNKGEEVHILSFFFWRAGSRLQKSIVGMMRSLIYQLFDTLPGLADFTISSAHIRSGRLPTWTGTRLGRILENALESAKDQHFCLLIDGLDEFEGEKSDLLDFIFRLQAIKNVKCCVSSRPELPLTARLSSYDQLRLQDFNYTDIWKFVNDKLSGVSHDHVQNLFYTQLVKDISSRAEGVFLWAALVVQSIVIGLDAGDDEETIRNRLDSTPAEVEALFVQMLNSVDKFHRQSLLFYVQAVRAAGIDGEPTSVALITISTMPKASIDHEHLLTQCSLTEKRIIAQSKGLLEVSEADASEIDFVWSIASDGMDDIPKLKAQSRLDSLIERRAVKDCGPLEQALLEFGNKGVSFIHRSAFDFMSSPECELVLGNMNAPSMASVQTDLMSARLKLLAIFPSTINNECRTLDRIEAVIRSLSAAFGDDYKKKYAVMDELKDMMPLYPLRETWPVTAEEADDFEVLITLLSTSRRESIMYEPFWEACISNGYFDYVQDRSQAITRLTCRGILFAKFLNYAYSYLEERKIFLSKEQLRRILEFAKDTLCALVRLGSESSSGVPTRRIRLGEASLAMSQGRDYDISWSEDSKSALFADDEIVFSVIDAYLNWSMYYLVMKSEGTVADSDHVAIVLETEQILLLFKEIMEPWDLRIGTRPVWTSVPQKHCVVLEITPESWLENCHASRDHWSVSCRLQTYRSTPKLRVVCIRNGPKSLVRGVTDTGFEQRVVAVHDIGPWATWHILEFLRIKDAPIHPMFPMTTFRGTLEEYRHCQEMMINDVWANENRKLGSWQQLYLIACLKTRFQDTWFIPGKRPWL